MLSIQNSQALAIRTGQCQQCARNVTVVLVDNPREWHTCDSRNGIYVKHQCPRPPGDLMRKAA
jgi:hypothetical protein